MRRILLFLTPIFITTLSCSPQKKSSPSKDIFYLNLSSQPSTLHPIRASDAHARAIHDRVLDKLLVRNLETLQFEPGLAKSWKISSDKLVYTFKLRKEARWHDGKPLTAQDVKFSLDAVKDVRYGGAHFVSYFENITKAKVLDPHTIQFFSKEKYFGNFEKLISNLFVIPKHIYMDKDAKLGRVLVGSGPYILDQYDRNKKIVLKRNKNWWGNQHLKDRYHFKEIVYRIIQSRHDSLIRMKNGQLDFLSLSSEDYFKKTNKAPWGTKILKQKIENLSPKPYSFIGWNFKNPLFQNQKVRRALSHLIHRSLMNDKFSNGANDLVAGPTYPRSDYADPQIQPILFSPKKALKLLKEAGWSDSDKNGVLDRINSKNEKVEFKFTLIFPSKEFEKYLTIYQQDLKKNGILMSLKFMEWVSFLKAVNERSFDAVILAWTGSEVEWYPKQIWHSNSIDHQGSNLVSYRHKEVDRLIDLASREMNRQKRIQILRKVYRIISKDQPYSFMFSPRYGFYSHSKKVKFQKPTYKYGIGLMHWKPNI